MERTIKMAGTDWSQYSDILAERKAFMLEQPHEDVYQTAFDGLKLHAAYFPPIKENSEKKRITHFLFLEKQQFFVRVFSNNKIQTQTENEYKNFVPKSKYIFKDYKDNM